MEDKDRISKLPEHVLHHVLSFIPTIQGCVQTSVVLSKSWRHLWSTQPSFFLDESLFREDEDDELNFLHVLDETLQGYIDRNLRLDEFTLRIKSQTVGHMLFLDLLYEWVPRVLNDMQVTKFSLTRIQPSNIFLDSAYLDLLDTLDSFHSDHLSHLHLNGCRLDDPIENRLRVENLVELHLIDVCIADHVFEKILLSCPLLETVHAIYCKELGSVTLTNRLVPRLKTFHLWFEDEPDPNTRLEIRDVIPTLEEIEIGHCPKWRSREPFHNLKSLTLSNVRLPKGFLDGFSTNFPRVERLDFSDCYGFKKIQLSSPSIKELKIVTPHQGEGARAWKVSIDAPNVTEFTYQGFIPRSLCFAATNYSGEWRTSRMRLSVEEGDEDWFRKLTRALEAVKSRSKIYLTLGKHDQDPGGPVFRKPRVVVLEQLSLIVSGHSTSSLSDFIIGLLPSLCPKEIGGCRYYLDPLLNCDMRKNELTETLCKILLGDEEGGEATAEVCYLKRSRLEEVVLEASDLEDDGGGGCWRCVHATTRGPLAPRDVLALLKKCEQCHLRFRLRWRS